MPFVQIYVDRGLDADSRTAISLSIHESLIANFQIPVDDYFQVVHEIGPTDLRYPSSYLGIPHSGKIVYIHITAKGGRTVEMKQALYRSIAGKIASRTGISADDVVIVLVENGVEDWSFGRGDAQMVTGAGAGVGGSASAGAGIGGAAPVGGENDHVKK
jgi:phenylpyruvate tautomerase PptA (4-oxalocrotonate tautomerase family)